MGKKSAAPPKGASQQRSVMSFWQRPAASAAAPAVAPPPPVVPTGYAAPVPAAWGAPAPLRSPLPLAEAPAPPLPPPPPPAAPLPPLGGGPVVESAPSKRRPRSSLPVAGEAWPADACDVPLSQAAEAEEREVVGWARDSPAPKRVAPGAAAGALLPPRAGGVPPPPGRASALSTLLGLGGGAARAAAPVSAPGGRGRATTPGAPAWEQWIAAAVAPSPAVGTSVQLLPRCEGASPPAARRTSAADASATPGLALADAGGAAGARRASAPTPGSLAAAVAAAAAAGGSGAPTGRAPRTVGTAGGAAITAPRTAGAGSRRQQKRAALLALLERIDAGTAAESAAAAEEAAAAAAAPRADAPNGGAADVDEFAVDPRDLAALLEAAAQPMQVPPVAPTRMQPSPGKQMGGDAAACRVPLSPNGAVRAAAAAPPAAPAAAAAAVVPPSLMDDDWCVPAPAPGAPLRVEAVSDEARTDGGGPARRLRLRDERTGAQYALELRDDWADTPAQPGDVVSIAAEWSAWGDATLRASGPGHAVLHPSMLLSATTIGSSLACLRRAALGERLGGGGASEASVFGSATHALFQAALAAPPDVRRPEQLAAHCDAAVPRIAAAAAPALASIGAGDAALRKHLANATPAAVAWVAAARGVGPAIVAPRPRGAPDAHVTLGGVVDIEEMVWAPRLGLKGQLDATVMARLGPGAPLRRVPMELKTGRFRAAAEHGAQVALYTLLLAEQYGADGDGVADGTSLPYGLLYYSAPDTRGGAPSTLVVSPDARETAALLHARNTLAAALATAAAPGGQLPPITASRSDCARCFKLAECALAARALENDSGAAAGVGDLFATHTAHVSPAAASFLRHWDAVCGAEVALLQQRAAAPWLPAADVRRRGGACLEELWLCGGAAALAQPRQSAPDADAPQAEEPAVEYDFLLCATAAPAAAASPDDGFEATGATPATLEHADDAAAVADAAVACLSAAGAAALGRFAAGDRVLLSAAAPAGSEAVGVTVLARASIVRIAPPAPEQRAPTGAGVALAVLTVRVRRAMRPPPRLGNASAVRWRLDRDDGAALVTRMRATVWALVGHPGPCRLRELVAELAPPRARVPVPPPPLDAPGAAAAAALAACLNPEQRAALDAVLACADFALLRGLPGTGKTATLAAAVAALVARGATVLLACHTHGAVDNALARLLAAGVPGVLRLGDPARVSSSVRPACLGSAAWPADSAEAVAAAAASARVVGATCHAAGSHAALQRRRFDVAFVDEAGQVPLPLALAPLSRADAFVLVGDPAQLPPLWAAPAARAAGGEESLFVRLAEAHPSAVTSLTVQYRMAEDIQVLANALVYRGALRCGDAATAVRQLLLPLPLPPAAPAWLRAALAPGARVLFLDTDALGGAAMEAARPLRNPGEAALAARIAAAALSAGAPHGAVALLTPYNAQVAALRDACDALRLPAGAVEATTVDRSQGRDLPAVVLSCVRTQTAAAHAGDADAVAGSLLDDVRRLCVALTRAQGKLLLLGSATALRTQPLTRQLVELCAARGWQLRLPPDALLN